ncbi:unnamed protein product [Rodentolepis nana]|uniref:Ig-like domain-containing protein n=1 Tax=Rodentolepis nana TaxID=102285 RepID=A0A158QID0_RODNA|nr:unnamed protein product [Rodentolepis nana]
MWPTIKPVSLLLLLLTQFILDVFSIPQPITYSAQPPLSISLSVENVSIGESVTIRCHINPRSEEGAVLAQSSMSLYCPATPKENFCFQNCRPLEECNSNNECRIVAALQGVTCRSITQSNGEIVFEYTVEHVTPEWIDWKHPGFSCVSATVQTNWTRLKEKIRPSGEMGTSPKSKTESTSTSTTTNMLMTTATQQRRVTEPSSYRDVNETKSVIISSPNNANEGKHWLTFLRNSSAGGIWTPEMIIIIALAALALSMLINCFCCLRWVIRRHHRNKRKLKGGDTFGCHSDFKAPGIPPAMAWYPADPRMIPAGAPLASQQMTPISIFRRSMAIPDESLIENPVLWSPFEGENAPRSHPEGKAANGSTLSNSAGRNSDSGFSLPHAISGPQPIQLIPNSGAHPINFEPMGWSGPVTPRSKHLTHRLRHQFVPSYYVGLKRATSRETVFSERPMSEVGFEPASHHPHHYVPVVLGPGGTVRASQPQLATMMGYGGPLCSPGVGSLIEKPGAGDGASAGGGSGSPKPGMTVLVPATVIGHQYEVMPPPSSSTERSSAPLLKADLTLKSKAMANEATLEESGNEGTGKSAAEVRLWLQSMPSSDKNHQSRLPTKLADSLNTDYDVASDWSEREPMLMRDKPPSSNETATTD